MKKIVITGGPCAGKTSVINALRERLGEQAVFVREVATILLGGGFPQPGQDLAWSETWQDCFQRAVIQTQRSLEQLADYQATLTNAQLIICDRGLLDGAAYAGGLEVFCQMYNINCAYETRRYEQIVHLESLATACPEMYGQTNNGCRYESLERAQSVEFATRTVWQHHPNYVFVPGAGNIVEKIEATLAQIQKAG